MIRDYETTIVLDPSLDDATVNAEVEKLSTLIQNHGGSIKKKVNVGKKRLAYSVNRKDYGIYVLLVHDGENSLVAALERQLEINENILRHLCVKKDKFAPDGEIITLDEVVAFDDELAVVDGAVDGLDDTEALAE